MDEWTERDYEICREYDEAVKRGEMTYLELVPKKDLPEWGEEDDRLMREFDERVKSGKLCLEN